MCAGRRLYQLAFCDLNFFKREADQNHRYHARLACFITRNTRWDRPDWRNGDTSVVVATWLYIAPAVPRRVAVPLMACDLI